MPMVDILEGQAVDSSIGDPRLPIGDTKRAPQPTAKPGAVKAGDLSLWLPGRSTSAGVLLAADNRHENAVRSAVADCTLSALENRPEKTFLLSRTSDIQLSIFSLSSRHQIYDSSANAGIGAEILQDLDRCASPAASPASHQHRACRNCSSSYVAIP